MMPYQMIPYPFSAIAGQEDLKLALILNAISPEVGGVLIRGEKGTAKSTAVRALAKLLPPIRVISGCPYSCDPDSPNPECPAGPHPQDAPSEVRPVRIAELPIGASTDRLVGTLDIEKALTQGVKAFEPGILASAHRGVLYVDEVNLLPDALVDVLLDAAAMSTNHVEREGVSVKHPARFILVGTMNPEEGELRPQLLDRFGVSVAVSGTLEPDERAEIVRRRLDYEADPEGFAAEWAAADAELARSIEEARRLLPAVRVPDEELHRIACLCAELGIDGLRGDIFTAKTARALAASEGAPEVSAGHVRRAAALALPHRRTRGPFEQPGLSPDELERMLEEDPDPDPSGDGGPSGNGHKPREDQDRPSGDRPGSAEESFPAAGNFNPPRLEVPGLGESPHTGRRGRTRAANGHPVGAVPMKAEAVDIALAATLRAAAPHQLARGRSGRGLVLRREDFRERMREGRESNLVLFVVDSSGSMSALKRMSAVKGALLSLLADAYRRRDRVALISFRREAAELLLPPYSSVELAAERLRELPTGGRTPLASGLLRAAEVLRAERLRDPERRPLLVLLTDGRSTTGPSPREAAARLTGAGVASVVIDTEDGVVRLGLAQELAGFLGAEYLRLEELAAGPTKDVAERRRVA